MKLYEVGSLIGNLVHLAVAIVEEVVSKPQAGAEKRPLAIDLFKQLVRDVVSKLPISDFWKNLIISVVNWDVIAGWLIDRAVATLNELGFFKKDSK